MESLKETISSYICCGPISVICHSETLNIWHKLNPESGIPIPHGLLSDLRSDLRYRMIDPNIVSAVNSDLKSLMESNIWNR